MQTDIEKDTIFAEEADLGVFDVLVEQVYAMIGNPLSVWAVAATIESLGIRDVDAIVDYGYKSVFDLAEDVYERVSSFSLNISERVFYSLCR